MDDFIDNFLDIPNDNNNNLLSLPLQNAKYIINILSPIILFSLSSGDELIIKTTNNTVLTIEMYLYYMQFDFYPKFIEYIDSKEKLCNDIRRDLFVEELSFEKAQPLLIKYFNISTDPRELKSINQNYRDNSITYKKETWFEFIRRKSPQCFISNNYYGKIRDSMRKLSVYLPTDDIWKYLYALKKFESIITSNTNKNV